MTTHALVIADKNATKIAELAASSFSYTHAWLAPGSASATIARRQFLAPNGTPIITSANLYPWGTRLYVLRDRTPVWGGLLTGRTSSPPSDQISLAGKGFLAYFREKRQRKATKTYTAQDQHDIARGIIDDAQAVAGGDLGIVTTDTNLSGVTRTRTFTGSERKPYADELIELALLDNGFDFRFDTYLNGDAYETALRCTYPATGRDTDIVLQHGSTCTVIDIDDDADALANSIDGTGAGEGSSMLLSTAADPSQLTGFPLLEGILPAIDITSQTLLDAATARDLTRRSQISRVVTVQIVDGYGPQIGDFVVGDRVRLVYSDDFETIDETMRILMWTVDVDGDAEVITITLGQIDPAHRVDEIGALRQVERRLALLERARRATP